MYRPLDPDRRFVVPKKRGMPDPGAPQGWQVGQERGSAIYATRGFWCPGASATASGGAFIALSRREIRAEHVERPFKVRPSVRGSRRVPELLLQGLRRSGQ